LQELVSKEEAYDKIEKVNKELSDDIEIIEKMIDKTEDFYGLIADKLPKIENNIDETIEETKLLINYFIETKDMDLKLDQGFKMSEVLEGLEEKIKKAYTSLSAQEDISDMLEGFMMAEDNEEAQFSKVLDLIKELEEVLSDLEDLSINAIIVSAKAGEQGAGFRVISNEINKLSADIKNKYKFIEESILILQGWYKDFTTNLGDLVEIEENIATKYGVEIEKAFNDILDSLQIIANMLKDFIDNIQWAIEPVYEIMVLTQNQDIIRQNLENLIKILKEAQVEINNLSLEDMNQEGALDILVFMNDVFNLAQKLMHSILSQLEDSLFAIQNKFKEMDLNLKEIKEDGEELTTFFAGKKEINKINQETISENNVSLELIYKNLATYISEFMERLGEVKNNYSNLRDNKDVFYENMERIQDQFEEISKIANQFNKIKLLAKIEFTRMPNTKQSFVDDIEMAIEDFIESSDNNQNLYDDLKDNLETNYNEFIKMSIQTIEVVSRSASMIEEPKDKLLLTKKMIKEAIQALQHSIENLVTEVSVVKKEMKECHNLKEKGQEVISSLEYFQNEVLELKEIYLDQLGVDNWTEKNDRLNELIDKFTSYLERKTAQEEVADLDIDVGSEGGELTLF
jgi:methyl-accepting chemotaxis protein